MKSRLIQPMVRTIGGALLVMSIFVNVAPAQIGELTESLTSQLGISEAQASGGVGALMNYAKQGLAPEKFAQVADALPDLTGLIGSMPAAGEASANAAQLATMLGNSEGASAAAQLVGLKESLDKLGLSGEQVAQFVPMIVDYAKSKGGDAVAALLRQALPAL